MELINVFLTDKWLDCNKWEVLEKTKFQLKILFRWKEDDELKNNDKETALRNILKHYIQVRCKKTAYTIDKTTEALIVNYLNNEWKSI